MCDDEMMGTMLTRYGRRLSVVKLFCACCCSFLITLFFTNVSDLRPHEMEKVRYTMRDSDHELVNNSTVNVEAVILRHRKRRDVCRAHAANGSVPIRREFWETSLPKRDFEMTNNHLCVNQPSYVDLLVIVPSSPRNKDRRQFIRGDWGNVTVVKDGILVVFFLGHSTEQHLQEGITQEQMSHGDIVQGDFDDEYTNLPSKIIGALHWAAHHCSRAEFIVKIDDDTRWAKLVVLLGYLRSQAVSSLVLCNSIRLGTPVARESGYRLSKWKTSPEDYPDECYPAYCDGCAGYAFTSDVARSLVEKHQSTKEFWLEDVYITGLLPYLLPDVSTQILGNRGQFIEVTCDSR